MREDDAQREERLWPWEREPDADLGFLGDDLPAWFGKGGEDLSGMECLSAEQLRFISEHYRELPIIDHRTGGPAGEIL